MRIAVGGDERTPVTDAVISALKERGHSIVGVVGPVGGGNEQWPDCGRIVGEMVASSRADHGICFCWTGTGVSIAANKVAGVRAALCTDPDQAAGARKWNDANVLALSLALTTETRALEILDSWFAAEPDPSEAANIAKL
ncbi:MAG: RpiB/LacA/LacB family sugar-phosphate isomerase [Actinomycetota bacterium]